MNNEIVTPENTKLITECKHGEHKNGYCIKCGAHHTDIIEALQAKVNQLEEDKTALANKLIEVASIKQAKVDAMQEVINVANDFIRMKYNNLVVGQIIHTLESALAKLEVK